MAFITEKDLLYFEPALVKECRSVAIKLAEGTCDIDGFLLVASGQTFITGTFLAPGMAIYLPSSHTTAVITDIDSDTSLNAAAVSQYMDDPAEPRMSFPTQGSNQIFEIYAFPQIRNATDLVIEELGLRAAKPPVEEYRGMQMGMCMNALAMIFRSMAAFDRTVYDNGSGGYTAFTPNDRYWRLAEYYEKQYRMVLRRTRMVIIDRNGDGTPDTVASLNTAPVRRE